jgi:hypothetical protein
MAAVLTFSHSAMKGGSSSSSSWTCPVCERRVPSRVDECYCGVLRSQVPKTDRSPKRSGLWLPLGALVAAVMIVIVFPKETPKPPTPLPPPTPSIQPYVPPAPMVLETPPSEWRVARTDPTPLPAPLQGGSPAEPQRLSSPSPDVHSTDSRRARGRVVLSAALEETARKVATLRSALEVHKACRWVRSNGQPYPQCPVAEQQLRSLPREIEESLEAADDAARGSWLEPGERRDAIRRHGLDASDLEGLFAEAAAARAPES